MERERRDGVSGSNMRQSAAMPQPHPFQHMAQERGTVGHDSVDPQSDETFHLGLFIDSPDMNLDAPLVGRPKEARRYHRYAVEMGRDLHDRERADRDRQPPARKPETGDVGMSRRPAQAVAEKLPLVFAKAIAVASQELMTSTVPARVRPDVSTIIGLAKRVVTRPIRLSLLGQPPRPTTCPDI
jgi:hypothetical protein